MQFIRKIILTLLIIVLCSALAFASEDSPSPEQAPLEVESVPDPWLSLETKTMELRATDKTITDVYNILNTGLMSGNNPKLDNIYSLISDCLEFYTDNPLHRYTIADLVGMTWGLVNSINNQLTSTNSILGNIYNNIGTTNAKLEYVFSAIEDTINIKWYASSHAYNGTSKGLDTNFLTSNDSGKPIYVSYNFNPAGLVTPQLYRITLPLRYTNPYSGYISLSNIYVTLDFNEFYLIPIPEHFIEFTTSGSYLYLFDWQPYTSNTYHYYFELTGPRNLQFRTNYDTGVFTIPFDTLDYQIIRTAFNQAKSANSLDELNVISSTLSSLASNVSSGSQAAEALADYFVSPQKQAAEDASSQVINSTLTNFTGSGSGAAKSSDSNAMKDVSGSIQSGLNGGGSVSGATGVFNSGSDFWGWFTQQNSNYINYPYPAPTVNSTRGSGDEIVDFLTPNSNELQYLLRQGGDQR